MTIKRIDRTKELMADLEKSASAGVKEAAIMLKVIAREMVSRRYVKSSKQEQFENRGDHWDSRTQEVERNIAKGMARRRFTGARIPFKAIVQMAHTKASQ